MDDPIAYYTEHIKDALDTIGVLTHEALDQIEADVRQMFGLGMSRDARSQRNRALIRDWQRGECIQLLRRRYGLSKSQVYAILKERFRFIA